MLHYSIDQKACRRKLIGKHFGEVWDSAKCNEMCDNCVLKKNGGMEPNYLQFVCTTKYSFFVYVHIGAISIFPTVKISKVCRIFFVLFIYFVVVCGVVLQGTVEQKNNMLVTILRQVCI